MYNIILKRERHIYTAGNYIFIKVFVFIWSLNFFFKELENNLLISVNITGLPKGKGTHQHGLHIHNNGITVFSDNVAEGIWICYFFKLIF